MSSGSSMISVLCIRARLIKTHTFYLGIDDFGSVLLSVHNLIGLKEEAMPTYLKYDTLDDMYLNLPFSYLPFCLF